MVEPCKCLEDVDVPRGCDRIDRGQSFRIKQLGDTSGDERCRSDMFISESRCPESRRANVSTKAQHRLAFIIKPDCPQTPSLWVTIDLDRIIKGYSKPLNNRGFNVQNQFTFYIHITQETILHLDGSLYLNVISYQLSKSPNRHLSVLCA